MPVGAPLVTPGAGTAQGVRDIARGVSAVLSVNRDVAAGHPGERTGCLRRCGGHPGDTSVAPTLRGARPRYCGRPSGRAHGLSAALRRPMRDNARRGATCDARCRNGTTHMRRSARQCPQCCRSIAALRQAIRAGAWGECGVAAVIRATQVSPLRYEMLVRGIAAGHPGGRTGCLRRCGSHPGDTSVAPTLRGARPRYCGKPWLSTVDDFDDRDGLDKFTFRYVTVRSYLDGAFSIRYVDVLTVIIRGRFIGQQKYNCPDRRHDHS